MSAGLPIPPEQMFFDTSRRAQGLSNVFGIMQPGVYPNMYHFSGPMGVLQNPQRLFQPSMSIQPDPALVPQCWPGAQEGLPMVNPPMQFGQAQKENIAFWPSGQLSLVNATYAAPPGPPMGYQTTSNMLTPAPTVYSSSAPVPSLSPQDHQPVASSSNPVSRSAKRKREDNAEDRPKKQRKLHKNMQQGAENQEACRETANPKVKGNKKKKKVPDGHEFVCRLCLMVGTDYQRLSRKDALKRHIEHLHQDFQSILDDDEDYDVLKPRKIGNLEDLEPLVKICLKMQREARLRGEEIEIEHDLALLYPKIQFSTS